MRLLVNLFLIVSCSSFSLAANGSPDEPTKTRQKIKLKAGRVSTILDDLDAGTGGLNIDRQGRLYCADFGSRLDGKGTGGHRIYRISEGGKSELFCWQLRGGSGNTFDKQGNLFQSSIGGNFISKIKPDGKVVLYCKSGLVNPVGLAFDSNQNLLVCNCGNNTIQKVDRRGSASTFCESDLLKCPNGITVGPDDETYVCNFSNGDVVRIDRSGTASRLATLPGKNNGHLIFHLGYLYVLARKDCRVYQVSLDGKFSVFAGTGERGQQDGAAFASSFSLPNSLIVSNDGKWMYLNETSPTSGDHRVLSPTRIRKVELLRD